IGGDGNDLAAGRLGNLVRRRLQRFLAPCTDRDIDALFRKGERNALTDAFASASYQRRLSFELEVPRSPPKFYRGLCASQRPPSAAANSSATAALKAAGS